MLPRRTAPRSTRPPEGARTGSVIQIAGRIRTTAMAAETISKRSATALGALAGLTAAMVALGAAELVAGLNRTWKGPILDVGDRVIDHVPVAVKDFAIETVRDERQAGAVVGHRRVPRDLRRGDRCDRVPHAHRDRPDRHRRVRSDRCVRRADPTCRWIARPTPLPSIIGAALGAGALWLAHSRGPPDPADRRPGHADRCSVNMLRTTGPQQVHGRRATVEACGRPGGRCWCAAVGCSPPWHSPGPVPAPSAERSSTASAPPSRGPTSRCPARRIRSPPIPDAVDVGVDGVAPFTTPNADFYRIDTALTVPQLPAEDYELRITGMVDQELRFSFDDLLRRNVVEYDITLTCVSNTIGGDLIGNARWLGRPARRTARGSRRPRRGRSGRRSLDRRLHVRLPAGSGHRRPQRHRRLRDER